jgi:hypothetical protein
LLEKDWILARDLLKYPRSLDLLNLTERRRHQLQTEIKQLCGED